MDSVSAMLMGMQHGENAVMVFDWNKAARIINERKGETASAGLRGDWEYTGGDIWVNGAPVDDNDWLWLSSTWAIPELAIGNDIYPCWVYQKDSPGWHEKTMWPDTARQIVGATAINESAPAIGLDFGTDGDQDCGAAAGLTLGFDADLGLDVGE